jgi:hypothetical protein
VRLILELLNVPTVAEDFDERCIGVAGSDKSIADAVIEAIKPIVTKKADCGAAGLVATVADAAPYAAKTAEEPSTEPSTDQENNPAIKESTEHENSTRPPQAHKEAQADT